MIKLIDDYIRENLTGDDREAALDFTAFLRAQHLQFVKDESACWKDKIYYWVKHNNTCVCFIALADPDEPENRWTVWSDDIDSGLLTESLIADNMRQTA